MLVVLDSTVLVSDPTMSGVGWKILAQAVHKWGVQVCVPEVVRVEVVAGYRRRHAHATNGLDRWAERYSAQLGLRGVLDSFHTTLAREADSYPDTLAAKLAALPATVVAPPDVDHLTLVQRAADRVPPCDDNGDGYRDTLNWLLLCDLAGEHDRVLWVTADSDFGDVETNALDPALMAELDQKGLTGKIDRVSNLSQAALSVAALYGTDDDTDLDALQDRLTTDALTGYTVKLAMDNDPPMTVSPSALALPLAATHPGVADLSDVTDTVVRARATLRDGQAAVEVTFTATASITFRRDDDMPDTQLVGVDLGDDTWLVTKPVRLTALLTVDEYQRPDAGEITDVRALEDDPGHAAWRTLRRRRLLDSLSGSTQVERVVAQAFDTLDGSIDEAVAGLAPTVSHLLSKIDSSVLRAARAAPPVDPAVLDAVRSLPRVDPAVLDAVRSVPRVDPAVLDAIRSVPRIDPAVLDAMKDLPGRGASRPFVTENDAGSRRPTGRPIETSAGGSGSETDPEADSNDSDQ